MKKNIILAGALLLFGTTIAVSPLLAQNISVYVNYSNSHTLQKGVYGVNNWISTRPYYMSDQSFIDNYEDLGKPTMRYPGGTPSNFLNFSSGFHEGYDGISDNNAARLDAFNNPMITNGKPDGEDINKYIDFMQHTDAKTTFTLNICSMTAAEVETALRTISDRGEVLEYVEIGNELYYNAYSDCIANEQQYITIAKQRATLVRGIFPNARIGVIVPSQIFTTESFLPQDDNSDTRQEAWYTALSKETFYDAIIIHLYASVGMNNQTTAANFLPYKDAYRYSISHVDKKLTGVFATLATDFPDKDIWITEYHLGGFGGELRSGYRMRHAYLGGLFAANFMFKMFADPDIEISSWHSMVQWLLFDNPTGANLLPNDYNFETGVNYHFFKFFKEPVNTSDSFVKVEFPENLGYSGVGTYSGTFNDLEGGVFFNSQSNKAYLMVMNKWDTTYAVNVSTLQNTIKGVITKCTQFTTDSSLNQTVAGDVLAHRSEDSFEQSIISSVNGSYTLKPFSMYLMEYDINEFPSAIESIVQLQNVGTETWIEVVDGQVELATTNDTNSDSEWKKIPYSTGFLLQNSVTNTYLASEANSNNVVEITAINDHAVWQFTNVEGAYYIDNIWKLNVGNSDARIKVHQGQLVLLNYEENTGAFVKWSEEEVTLETFLMHKTTQSYLASDDGIITLASTMTGDEGKWQIMQTGNTMAFKNKESGNYLASDSSSNNVIEITALTENALWVKTPSTTAGAFYIDNQWKLNTDKWARLKITYSKRRK